ncbi:caspase family protein [Ferrimonas balearica]|uniref:caspase family protein n=1 Tax=Ferrimonas balearica TaxID=44012 RepID=UPI001C96562C|nr:caspase family protein [Ferrimonas balearica]MBY6106253.1 caspase family protein [Ferrimonas balearica]
MMKASFGLVAAAMVLGGCSSTSTYETISDEQVIPNPVPLAIEVDDIHLRVENGLVVARPRLQGTYQDWVKKVGNLNTQYKDVNEGEVVWATLFGVAATALIPIYPLVMTGWSDCEFSECTYEKGDQFTRLEKLEPREATLEHRIGEVYVHFKGDNQREYAVPLSPEGVASISLLELGYPDRVSATLSFSGALSAAEIDNDDNRITVPQQDQLIADYIAERRVVIDGNNPYHWHQLGLTESADETSLSQSLLVAKGHLEANFTDYVNRYHGLPSARTFATVEKPQVLPGISLTRDEFETSEAFAQRQRIAQEKRAEQLAQIRYVFEQQVAMRDNQVMQENRFLEQAANRLIADHNQRIERAKALQQQRSREHTIRAFLHSLGQPKFTWHSYDADHQRVSGYVYSQNERLNYPVQFTMPAETARKLKAAEADDTFVTLEYDLSLPDEVVLETMQLTFAGERYPMKATPSLTPQQQQVFRFADAQVEDSFVPIQPAAAAGVQLAELQNPYASPTSLSALTASLKGTLFADGEQDFRDDIPDRLRASKARPVSHDRWLMVIGIEDYALTDNILYARRSAELFTQVAQKQLGVPAENTVQLIDQGATTGAIKSQLQGLLARIKPGDTLYFYYNGHGIPDPNHDNAPFILPQDMSWNYVGSDSALKLENLLAQLQRSRADKVVAFMDSCFSGQTDGQSLMQGTVAASRLVPKAFVVDQGRMTILSAGTSTQFSNAYKQRGNRLFSYYLMQGLLSGQYDVGQLHRQVAESVTRESLKIGTFNRQEPTLQGNSSLRL